MITTVITTQVEYFVERYLRRSSKYLNDMNYIKTKRKLLNEVNAFCSNHEVVEVKLKDMTVDNSNIIEATVIYKTKVYIETDEKG